MLIGTFSSNQPIDFPETDQFIFSLTAFHVKSVKKYPRKIGTIKIGYFNSLDAAENYLRKYCHKDIRARAWDKTLHHFALEKWPLNSELIEPLGYWIYLKRWRIFSVIS